MYQIREIIKEFAIRILPLKERFLEARLFSEFLSFVIVDGHRSFLGCPFGYISYHSSVKASCSSTIL